MGNRGLNAVKVRQGFSNDMTRETECGSKGRGNRIEHMGGSVRLFDDEVHHQFMRLHVQQLSTNARAGMPANPIRVEMPDQRESLPDEDGALVFFDFLNCQLTEIEMIVQEKPGFLGRDFNHLFKIETFAPMVIFTPKSRNGGRADLHMVVYGFREVHSEKRIAQVGDRIDMALQQAVIVIAQVDALKRNHRVSGPGPKMPGDLVGIEAGRVEKVMVLDGFILGEHPIFISADEALTIKDPHIARECGGDVPADLLRIDAGSGR